MTEAVPVTGAAAVVGVPPSAIVVLVAGADADPVVAVASATGAVVAALSAVVAVAGAGAVVCVGAAPVSQPASSVATSKKSVANFKSLSMRLCITTVSLLSFFGT